MAGRPEKGPVSSGGCWLVFKRNREKVMAPEKDLGQHAVEGAGVWRAGGDMVHDKMGLREEAT